MSFSPRPTLGQLRAKLARFAAERDWDQFHTPRNLVLALVGEVGELAEVFQWKGEMTRGAPELTDRERVALEHELADVVLYAVRLADVCCVDLPTVCQKKLDINALKYPVALARGSSAKYTAHGRDASGARVDPADRDDAHQPRGEARRGHRGGRGSRPPPGPPPRLPPPPDSESVYRNIPGAPDLRSLELLSAGVQDGFALGHPAPGRHHTTAPGSAPAAAEDDNAAAEGPRPPWRPASGMPQQHDATARAASPLAVPPPAPSPRKPPVPSWTMPKPRRRGHGRGRARQQEATGTGFVAPRQ